jgi:hypothetical protein
MTIARVNTSGKKLINGGAEPYAFGSLGFSPAAGNCLVIYGGYVCTGGTSGVSSVTDNLGGTWTTRTQFSGPGTHVAFIAWRENIPAGITTVTVHGVGGASGYVAIAVDEFTDIVTASAQDQTNGGSGAMASAAVSSGNVTTTNAADLLLTAAVSDDNGTTAWNAIGGSGTWTQSFQEADSTTTAPTQTGYQVVLTTGTYNSTHRYTISTNADDAVVIVALKAVAQAAGPALMAQTWL